MELTKSCGGEADTPLVDRCRLLIEAARQGDPDGLGRALELFRDYLLLVANQELEPELKAKLGASDLVQETFLGAQRDLASFRGQSEAEWRLWLRGILVHLLANHRRRFRSTGKRRVDCEVPLAATPRCDWPASHPSPSHVPGGDGRPRPRSNRPWTPWPSIIATWSSGITATGCRSRRWAGGWGSRPMPPASSGRRAWRRCGRR